MPTPKLGHKIALAALSLIVAFFAAGFIYVALTDHGSSNNVRLKPAAETYQPIKPPPKPGPNARVGVAEEAFDNPVTPGATTSIIINTAAGATCTISVNYSPAAPNPDLHSQSADAYGVVTWSWNVPANIKYGDYPVAVTCRLGKNWAVYDDTLIVKD